MSLSDFFLITPSWKEPKCLPGGEWGEACGVQWNTIRQWGEMTDVAVWRNLKAIILSEGSQAQRGKILWFYLSETREKTNLICSVRSQIRGYLGPGEGGDGQQRGSRALGGVIRIFYISFSFSLEDMLIYFQRARKGEERERERHHDVREKHWLCPMCAPTRIESAI